MKLFRRKIFVLNFKEGTFSFRIIEIIFLKKSTTAKRKSLTYNFSLQMSLNSVVNQHI